ncbi:outer membrane protein assembly factor BamB family protein [Halostagnicola kamekurae]|uniref:Outer membrane protein assembly factor BamB, contains PQQ-like beta-propeller repeat n=1 Tax=Halostagnicola kamekurae TaxID=619731 RepID=A0A1I6PD45_9EURY|nr:PQQ-binding-like beta-propeller repeat protein [Halostagnicola kamekurae]SFS38083.1 Outer membrane protein assembly factor BamB, contains PQQ-like beta-propeller repeat [Halostagnicola kamekurae]
MSDWNQFRHDHENSGRLTGSIDEEPERPEPTWDAGVDGSVDAPPVLDRDTVYVGSSAGTVYAFDRYDGRRRWRFETELTLASSLVVTDDSLLVVATDGTVFALEPETGTLRWQGTVSGRVESPPTLSRGVLFIGHGEGVSALEATTGEPLWTHETEAGVVGAPATLAGTDFEHVYVGTSRNRVGALEAETGEEVWAAPTKGSVVGGPTAVPGTEAPRDAGAARIGDDRIGVADRDPSALDPSDDPKSDGPEIDSPTESGLEFGGTDIEPDERTEPLAVEGDIDAGEGDRVYVADDGGLLLALNARTGQSWFTYQISDPFTTAPTVTDDSVFVGAADGYLHVTDTMFGKRKLRGWLFSKKGVNLDGIARAEPALVGDTLCLGDSSGSLYGIDADDPDFGWHYPLEAGVSSGPAISDGSLYVVTDDTRLHCLSWRDETSGWD